MSDHAPLTDDELAELPKRLGDVLWNTNEHASARRTVERQVWSLIADLRASRADLALANDLVISLRQRGDEALAEVERLRDQPRRERQYAPVGDDAMGGDL